MDLSYHLRYEVMYLGTLKTKTFYEIVRHGQLSLHLSFMMSYLNQLLGSIWYRWPLPPWNTSFSYLKRNTIFSWFSSYLSGLSSSASFAGSSSSADSDLSPLLFSKCPHPRRYLHARYRYFHITISSPDLSLELWIYISGCLFDRPTSPHGWLKCLSVVYILKHSFFPDQY